MLATGQRTHYHNIWSRNIFPVSMEGCVLSLPLWQEDVQGTTLLSYDQYHHPSTVAGATWGSTGRTFDGASYITINPAATILQTLTVGSIEVWVRLTTTQSGAFFSISDHNDAASNFALYWNLGNGIYVYCVEAGTAYYNSGFNDAPLLTVAGGWYHLVLNHNGTTMTLILDGVSYSKKAEVGADFTKFLAAVLTINDVELGAYYPSAARGLFLKGVEGEIRVYNRVLTVAEAQHNREVTRWRYQ